MSKSNQSNLSQALVIGVGNLYRGDDGLGIVTARHVAAVLPDVTVIEHSGEGTSLMALWESLEPGQRVILVDAASSGAAPGTIHRLDAATQPIPARFFAFSTHSFGVAEAIEMARTLGQLPAALIIYAIEGKTFESGEGLSPEAAQAAQLAAGQIAAELGDTRAA